MSVAAPPPARLTADEFVRLPVVVRANGRAVWSVALPTATGERWVPDVAIECRTPCEMWGTVFRRVVDHLKAGVPVACLLDYPSRTLSLFRPNDLPKTLAAGDEFTLPVVPRGLRVKVVQFFA
jgi:Uma2 family endonuclease